MAVLIERRHLVIGDGDRTVAVCAALEEASVGYDALSPEALVRIESLGACGLPGWRVVSADGAVHEASAVVLVSPPTRLPWLDPGLLDWEAGRPALVAGLLAPGLANLYVLGLGTTSSRPSGLRLLVEMIHAQAALSYPFVDELMCFIRPTHDPSAGRAERRVEKRVHRKLKRPDAQSWWTAARELEGPLTGARSS